MDFTPPSAHEIDPTPPPSYRLFDGNAVGIATFLGTVFAGTIVVALNEFKLGRSGRAMMFLVGGFLFTVVYSTVAFLAPESLSAIFNMVNIGIAIGAYKWADNYFAKDFEAHTSAGGEVGMRWWAAGIGLIMLTLVFGIMFIAIIVSEGLNGMVGYDDCLAYQQGSETVCYNAPITQNEAQCTMDYMASEGGFTGEETWSTFLTNDGTLTFSLVVQEERVNEPAILESFELLRQNVQDQCFSDQTLQVDLIRSDMTLIRSIN